MIRGANASAKSHVAEGLFSSSFLLSLIPDLPNFITTAHIIRVLDKAPRGGETLAKTLIGDTSSSLG